MNIRNTLFPIELKLRLSCRRKVLVSFCYLLNLATIFDEFDKLALAIRSYRIKSGSIISSTWAIKESTRLQSILNPAHNALAVHKIGDGNFVKFLIKGSGFDQPILILSIYRKICIYILLLLKLTKHRMIQHRIGNRHTAVPAQGGETQPLE